MTTYAVISSGNKQYQVKLGDVVKLEKLEVKDKTITFDQVLLYHKDGQVEVGEPSLKDKTVVGEVLAEAQKDKKVRVFKFKAKSRYRKTKGHRQTHTVVKIVELAGEKLVAAKPKPVKVEKPAVKAKAPVKKVAAAKKPAATKKSAAPKKPAVKKAAPAK